jgi:predicted AAA+ superfamily ATPase
MAMKRRLMADLERWSHGRRRKPLVVRGARQVGKSWLIRTFGAERIGPVVELNFERDPQLARCFAGNEPKNIVRRIENATGKLLRPDGTNLLMLDEVQAAPEVLAKLRWFGEELPSLPVIATGSLLDFALAEHTFSMPVGRISYLHLEPMGFVEFLEAVGEDLLANRVREAELDDFRGAAHDTLMARFREYLLVGGMPTAVQTWVTERTFAAVAEVQRDLLATLRDDFAKYADRVHHRRLQAVFAGIPHQLGERFSYARVDRSERAAALGRAVELLSLARVAHRVRASPALRPPLEAGASDRHFKMLFCDVGLANAALGLRLSELDAGTLLAHSGGVAEQVVGQLLRLTVESNELPTAFFWKREERGSEAEVDYVVADGTRLVPIEVKAGSTGTLKSLHALMAARRWKSAVRFSDAPPQLTEVDVHAVGSGHARYRLLSLPLYLVEALPRLLAGLR